MKEKNKLTKDDWQEIKAIFNKLVEFPESNWNIQLDQLCKNNSELKLYVQEMFEVYLSSQNQTITPVKSAASTLLNESLLKSGDGFGKYTIIKAIGSGGMGQVYLAQRNDEVIQEVAIKVLNQGAMDEQSQLRFDIERRILASLEHPNICLLYTSPSPRD